MIRSEIEDKLIDIFKNNNLIEMTKKLDFDASLSNVYGIDSIKLIDIIVQCEEEFNIEFDLIDLDLNNFKSIRTFIETIERVCE